MQTRRCPRKRAATVRGRPPTIRIEPEPPPQPPPPEIVLTPIERQAIDYSEFEQLIAQAEQAIRSTAGHSTR
jgi:hypothetical protein